MSDSVRLRADPVTFPTSDDGEGQLRFSLLSFSVIEEVYGSFEDGYKHLREANFGPGSVAVLGNFLRAGMATLGAVPSVEEALATVDLRIDDAFALVFEALNLALPPPGKAVEGDQASTGTSSTTPPPSDGDEPASSSGT